MRLRPSGLRRQIAAFNARHPIGTKARLAMTLMLYTGCRRADAVLLGRANIRGGFLTYTQQKNRIRKPVTLTIPVHSELRRSMPRRWSASRRSW
jgi:integrase